MDTSFNQAAYLETIPSFTRAEVLAAIRQIDLLTENEFVISEQLKFISIKTALIKKLVQMDNEAIKLRFKKP